LSVTASVECTECRVAGPSVGDGGAIGFPSAEDSPRLFGQLSSFAYIYEGLRAVGAVTWELAATRAFVEAHAGHRMALYFEGEEYGGRPGAAPATRGPLAHFSFDEAGFLSGFFEVCCPACGSSFRESWPSRYRPLDRHVISRGDWREFQRRVRLVDSLNFHRLAGVLDWHGDQSRLASFLEAHGRHAPVARVVHEEEWRAPALGRSAGPGGPVMRPSWLPSTGHVSPRVELAPPLRLLFRHGDASHYMGAPVVGEGLVFAVTGWERQELVALDADGRAVWSRPVHTDVGFGGPLCLTKAGLALVETEELAGRPPGTRLQSTLTLLEPDTGRVLWSTPTRFRPVSWAPERDLLVGIEPLFEPERRDTLARVSISEGLPVAWEVTRPSARQRFGWLTALAGERLFTLMGDDLVALDAATGGTLWQTPLATFGKRWSDTAACLAVDGDRVVFSLLGATVGFDAADGRPVWQMSGPGASGPWMLYEARLYSTSGAYRVVDVPRGVTIVEGAADPDAAPPPPAARYVGLPVVTGTHVFVVDSPAGRLWALDRDDGRPVWMHRPPDGFYAERPVGAGGRLFLQGRSGLLCYGPA
jgi:outer membrane protein assembly factor BamB